MVLYNEIKVGDKLYTTETHSVYEVIRETKSAFYLAIFNGSCSRITYIPKSATRNDFFRTKAEANAYKVKELRRMADYIENKTDQKDEGC